MAPDSEKIDFRPHRVLLESIVFVWWYRFRFLKSLSIPTLVLVAIWALHSVFQNNSSPLSGWGFWFLYQAGFVFFAIACHRLVLLNETDFTVWSIFNRRVARFLFLSLIAAAGTFMISGIILTIVINLPMTATVYKNPGLFFVINSLATIPAFYVLGRFILIFPATAVDADSGLLHSWRQTKGHGWKIVLVIGVYPWLISMLIWLAAGDGPNLLVQVITALLYYLGLALEVTALSFAYKSFAPIPEQNANNP